MADFTYKPDDMFETKKPVVTDAIFEFANIPPHIHRLDIDIKFHIAQPGEREGSHAPRVKVFRNTPDEPDAFVIRLSQNPNGVVLQEGNFGGLMNRAQFNRVLAYVKKYRFQLLNLWYRPGADILELQDEIAAINRGEVVSFHGNRRGKMNRLGLVDDTNRNEAILVSEIEDLLERTREFRQSDACRRFFETLSFIKQSRYLAPYNALLVKQQRPDATFVLTEDRWLKFHGRRPRPGVQPLVVMIPFGPVDFVFDLKDIDGIESHPLPGYRPNLPTEEICRQLYPVVEAPPSLDVLMRELIRNCRRQGLTFDEVPLPIQLAGRVRLKKEMERPTSKTSAETRLANYVMEINSAHPVEVRFAALAHELAHIYCNHMNETGQPYFNHKTEEQAEFEAETVAYLFCYRHGFRPRSEHYLVCYLQEGREPQLNSFKEILNALKRLEDLLKPEEIGEVPAQFEISIGGYLGKSYSLELQGNALRHTECGQGYKPIRTIDVTPTKAQWANFWKSCQKVGLWSWEERYNAEDVVDGTQWAVRIDLDDRVLVSSGSNDYPGADRYQDYDPYPPPFSRFLKAVSRLAGGLEIG